MKMFTTFFIVLFGVSLMMAQRPKSKSNSSRPKVESKAPVRASSSRSSSLSRSSSSFSSPSRLRSSSSSRSDKTIENSSSKSSPQHSRAPNGNTRSTSRTQSTIQKSNTNIIRKKGNANGGSVPSFGTTVLEKKINKKDRKRRTKDRGGKETENKKDIEKVDVENKEERTVQESTDPTETDTEVYCPPNQTGTNQSTTEVWEQAIEEDPIINDLVEGSAEWCPAPEEALYFFGDATELLIGGGSGGGNAEFYLSALNLLSGYGYGLLFRFPNERKALMSVEEGGVHFSEYPYRFGEEGMFRRHGWYGEKRVGNVMLHMQSDGGAESLSGFSLQAKYSPTRVLNLNFMHTQLISNAEDGRGLSHQSTAFFVEYNRVKHHKIQLWWGLGLGQQTTERIERGLLANVGFQYFIKAPVSWYNEATVNLGWGEQASFQSRLQLHLNRFTVYGGYQYNNLGALEMSQLTVGGGMYF